MSTSDTTVCPEHALKLLSSMYLCEPSPQAVTAWFSLLWEEDGPFFVEIKCALQGIDLSSEEALEALRWDYTRLFVGPYKLPCPPWESVYTSEKRLLMQSAAIEAKRIYAKCGVTLDGSNVMPDHIGAELNFLALACSNDFASRGDKSQHAQIAVEFLREHLLNWVPRFTHDLETSAETIFYQSLARETRRVLHSLNMDALVN